MAYSLNWATKVITIPKADMPLLQASPEIRELTALDLWTKLRDIEDDVDGIVNKTIVKNTPPLTVAGITLARVVEIINSYTITFEDLQYAVNVTGGNTNIADVVNKNQVSVNTANSAGLVDTAASNADALLDRAAAIDGFTPRQIARLMAAVLLGEVSGTESTPSFKGLNGVGERVRCNVDADSNRSNFVYTP